MSISPFDSKIYGNLFFDEEISNQFSDSSELSSLIKVESALAKIESELGIIPRDAGQEIVQKLSNLQLVDFNLAAGTRDDGIPIPTMVKQLREIIGGEAGNFVHFGATSQDIIDTALILRLQQSHLIIDRRLAELINHLKERARSFIDTIVPARTRSQQATPTILAMKIAVWISALKRHQIRLEQIQQRLFVLQFGGASGTLASLEGRGIEVMEKLATELELGIPELPWHSNRDNLAEFSSVLTLISSTLGKVGQDLIQLGQTEIQELSDNSNGGSSTMPQKSNPVNSEILVATARHQINLNSTMQSAVLHVQERDGTAWTSEWLGLPQIVVLTGNSLNYAIQIAKKLKANKDMIQTTLDSSRGLLLAEAATFALTNKIPLPTAQKLVKNAVNTVVNSGENLIDYLAKNTDYEIDWDVVKDPQNYLGNARDFVQRIIEN